MSKRHVKEALKTLKVYEYLMRKKNVWKGSTSNKVEALKQYE